MTSSVLIFAPLPYEQIKINAQGTFTVDVRRPLNRVLAAPSMPDLSIGWHSNDLQPITNTCGDGKVGRVTRGHYRYSRDDGPTCSHQLGTDIA